MDMKQLEDYLRDRISEYEMLRDVSTGRCKQKLYAGKVQAYADVLDVIIKERENE